MDQTMENAAMQPAPELHDNYAPPAEAITRLCAERDAYFEAEFADEKTRWDGQFEDGRKVGRNWAERAPFRILTAVDDTFEDLGEDDCPVDALLAAVTACGADQNFGEWRESYGGRLPHAFAYGFALGVSEVLLATN